MWKILTSYTSPDEITAGETARFLIQFHDDSNEPVERKDGVAVVVDQVGRTDKGSGLTCGSGFVAADPMERRTVDRLVGQRAHFAVGAGRKGWVWVAEMHEPGGRT